MVALTKEFFPLREESRRQVAQWFHALSEDTRLQILDRLSEGEECVCDLTTLLEAGQSRLSFHLKILKDAGIVTDRREGRWVYYALNPDVVDALQRFVNGLKNCCQRLQKGENCCN
ncbi:MAG: metalloregulator ArsR/SmtB family transcription factor [candidate division KSB1 bacterium]|nr:metalloregulator ArsR/SmtB family transcription factor [candidate division KSB1 bacterium]